MFIPHPIYYHIGAFPVIGSSAQSAKYLVVNRILVWHVQFRRHYHQHPLPGEEFGAAIDTAKILGSTVNSTIHDHFPSVWEDCYYLFREINCMSFSMFYIQSRFF